MIQTWVSSPALTAVRVTLISAICCIVLGSFKMITGHLGHSEALFADGVHSLSDLLIDGLVLWAAKIGAMPADRNHPYGHKRIETLVSVLLSLMLLAVAASIIWDALSNLRSAHQLMVPSPLTIWAAIVSMVVNEVLYRLTLIVARTHASGMMHSHALHHRIDVLTSGCVLFGILVAQLGWLGFDELAACAVSVLIARMGWRLGWQGLAELVDTGALTQDEEVRVKQMIAEIEGVVAVHCLRTRSMAAQILLDVHVITRPTISVSEGHYIGEQVRTTLLQSLDKAMDVMVHVDSEDDEHEALAMQYPPRAAVLAHCHAVWGMTLSDSNLVLHYSAQGIVVDVFIPFEASLDLAGLKECYLAYPRPSWLLDLNLYARSA